MNGCYLNENLIRYLKKHGSPSGKDHFNVFKKTGKDK